MKLRVQIKQEKKQYFRRYKGFCRYMSTSREFKGRIKHGRAMLKDFLRKIRCHFEFDAAMSRWLSEYPSSAN